jgi:hypothetical protein
MDNEMIREARQAVARLRELGDNEAANRLAGAVDDMISRLRRLAEDVGTAEALVTALDAVATLRIIGPVTSEQGRQLMHYRISPAPPSTATSPANRRGREAVQPKPARADREDRPGRAVG